MSIHKIPPLHEFIKLIQSIPFVPSRNTYRLAEFFLKYDFDELQSFCNTIIDVRTMLETCTTCCCWKEKEKQCLWCGPSRDQSLICIIESWIDTLALERSGVYKGTYHVLGGAISPLDGILPEMLSFDILLERLKKSEEIQEVIIATNQTPEGDATAMYLERIIKSQNTNITITHLASGVPVGSSLEFVDKLTIGKAFSFRRKLI
jgi:recombination protein RecR